MDPSPHHPRVSTSRLRVVFFGTAKLACASLAALIRESVYDVVAVVTQPDRPKGRDLKLQPSAVKVLALRLGLPVWQPERCREPGFLETLRQAECDLIVVAAYGQILPPALLELPRHGCLNVHASLLPKYRGAAPIQWAILDGETQTGVTIMKVDAGLDTGDMLAEVRTLIGGTDTAPVLHDRLAALGADLLVRTIPDHLAGRIAPRPQPATGVSYARKITKEDGRADWFRPAFELDRRLRALVPWPGLYTSVLRAGRPALLKIWHASAVSAVAGSPGDILRSSREGILVRCGDGGLLVTELQIEGGRRLAAADFLAGHPLPAGSRLG